MSRTAPQLREVAKRFVAGEMDQQALSPGIATPAGFSLCEKLAPKLAALMGRAGYHALLSRALVLARKEVDWLRNVSLTEAGILGMEDDVKDVGAKELTVGSTALVAELLGLLFAFIGTNLTLGLVREVWPQISLEDLKFTN